MAAWEIVLLLLAGILLVLFLGGLAGNARMRARADRELTRRIAAADQALATARGEDRGWDPERLEGAARAMFAERHPGLEAHGIDLVQVIDRPGTDRDQAVLRARHAAGSEEIVLRRSGEHWSGA